MEILTAIGHLSSFVTIESEIRSAIQAGFHFRQAQKLKNLCGTLDFSSLSEELAPVADRVEGYLTRRKSDVLGDSLFSSEEKAEFMDAFFQTHPDALMYRNEVEEILSGFLTRLEDCLLRQMSPGEKLNYRVNRRIEEKVDLVLEKTDELTARISPSPSVSPVSKIPYDAPNDYIPRLVIPHAVAMLDEFERLFQPGKPTTLAEALEADDHLLLLSDAGHGKSIELQNLAGVLYKTEKFPWLYSLSQYCGEPIQALLPYRDLPPERLVLLFDGYDEMQSGEREEFMRRLRSFIRDHAAIKAVISSRSNFCKAEIENQSRTFQGFQVYDLDDLTGADILDYLSRQSIDADPFIEAARHSETEPLLRNPFYLIRLARLYQKHGRLPGKAEVMDYLIAEGFRLDDQKFQENLEEQRRNLFVLLEKVAFAMQLMQKPALDDSEEYQELFTLDERRLLKCSGLLRKEGARWRFVHNNFKEYLAAKFLSALPRDEAIPYFSSGHDIKMSWVNTFGFFVSIEQEWDLKSWIIDNVPAALVKFEPDHLEYAVRADIFKAIFLEREKAMLWIDDNLYSIEQLAAFACCEETLEFLLDKIVHPVHWASQISAIQLLQYFRLFGRRDETARALLACCADPAGGQEAVSFYALKTLSELNLVTPEVAAGLVERYRDCSETHLRWAMYQLLTRSGQHNAYVQFFLDGMAYAHGNGRMANETIALADGLTALSEPESIRKALRYLARARTTALYNEDEIYEALCVKAAEQFSQGRTEYYQTFVDNYLSAAKHCSHRKMYAAAHFFEATGTFENAVMDLCDSVEHCYDLDGLFYRSENLAYAEKGYRDGRLKRHSLFREIVERYADDDQYREYRDLILEIDGSALPQRKPRVDYEKLDQERAQAYFDLLFDRSKAERLLALSIQKTRLPDPTVKDLIQSSDKFEYGSPLWELNCGLHRNLSESIKAKDVFQVLDWTRFVILEACSSIQREKTLQVSDGQNASLRELLQALYAQNFLENAVTYDGESPQTSLFVTAAVFLTVYLRFVPEEPALLQMIALPDFCFSEKVDTRKYTFLKAHLPKETLLNRIVENVKTRSVHGSVLRDHIEFCMEYGCEDIREFAIEAARMDERARAAAIEYLYNVFGPHCIQKELLPSAGQSALLDIDRLCPDLSKEHLRGAMERQFQTAPSLELMARLLTFDSEPALREYIRLAEEKMAPPESDGHALNGPTEAISALRDPKLLPLLERLMEAALSPDFQDREFCSLRTNLSNAMVSCGNEAPETVMAILQAHQGTPEKNEYAFRLCSYTMEALKQAMSVKEDLSWKIHDVIQALKAVS